MVKYLAQLMSYAKGMTTVASDRRNEQRPDLSGLASALRISVMRLSRRLRAERSEDGLTVSQLSALGILEREGPLSPTQLAARSVCNRRR